MRPHPHAKKPSGKGMHRAAGAMVWVPKPPVPDRQATFWPTFRCVTPSPTAATTPAYSEPGTNGRGGFIWYLFCTISRSGKFRLAALISMSTSPALGVGVGSSVQVSASTPVGLVQSQACMGMSPVCLLMMGRMIGGGAAQGLSPERRPRWKQRADPGRSRAGCRTYNPLQPLLQP